MTEELPIVFLLNTFQPLVSILNDVCTKVKQYCPRIGSEEMKSEEENVIAVWTRESKHNYEDNAKITEVCWSGCLFVFAFHPSIHLSIHPICLSYIHLFCLSIHPLIRRSIHLSIHASISSIYLSNYLSIYVSMPLSIYPSIHLSIYPFHLSIYPLKDFICPTAQKFVIEFDSRCHTERR